jgi:hypothetical protein
VDKYVFWPGDLREGRFAPFALETEGGSIDVTISTYNEGAENQIIGEQSMTLYFEKLENKLLKNVQRNLRGIAGRFSRQLKLKGLDPKNHAALYAKSSINGMEIRMIFNTATGPQKILVDVEVSVQKGWFKDTGRVEPVGPVESKVTTEFACPADDLDMVTGLVKALEETLGELKVERDNETEAYERQTIADKISDVSKALVDIDEHRQALEKHILAGGDAERFKVGESVNAAIKRGLDVQWQRVGLRWKAALDKNYYRIHKNDTIRKLEAEVEQLGVPDTDEEDFKSKLKKWALGKKGKVLGRLRALEKILTERSNEVVERKRLKFEEMSSDAEFRAYDDLNIRVTTAIAEIKRN